MNVELPIDGTKGIDVDGAKIGIVVDLNKAISQVKRGQENIADIGVVIDPNSGTLIELGNRNGEQIIVIKDLQRLGIVKNGNMER